MSDVLESSTCINRIEGTLATIAVMLAVVISGCSSDREAGQKQDSDRPTATRGEHDRDGGQAEHDQDGEGHHGEEGEESAVELGLNETCDKVRNGARLILAYDVQSNSFNGTVENTTDTVLKQVRVEVHLSNGKELAPTTPADLGPGQRREVRLTATNKDFDGWTAHPEVGIGELGHGEGPGEHDREGRSEHK
jgi:hypothetical protein